MSTCAGPVCEGTVIDGRVDGRLSNLLDEAFCSPTCRDRRASTMLCTLCVKPCGKLPTLARGAHGEPFCSLACRSVGNPQCAECWAPAHKGPDPCTLAGKPGELPLHFCSDEHRTDYKQKQRKERGGGRPTRSEGGNARRVSLGLSPHGKDELARQARKAERSESGYGAELLEDALERRREA